MDRPDKKAIPIREWMGAVWDDTTEQVFLSWQDVRDWYEDEKQDPAASTFYAALDSNPNWHEGMLLDYIEENLQQEAHDEWCLEGDAREELRALLGPVMDWINAQTVACHPDMDTLLLWDLEKKQP
jgi:hypothetical protein